MFNQPWFFIIWLLLANISNSAALPVYTSIAQRSVESNQFPLRSKFSNALTISHQDLARKFHNVLIIDVRSTYEFDVLHINGAINVPITNLGFIPTLKVLRANDNREIVFYCNGTTCNKSYIANIKAQQHGIKNSYTFDLGILSWAKNYPNKSTFFDSSPLHIGKLISTAMFNAHSLSPEKFIDKIGKNTLVFDIREPSQRGIKILTKQSILAPLGEFHHVLSKIQKQHSTLLIYDSVGKQVKWLQYLLEKQGIKNYYFMRGGVKAYLESEIN
jgi:rhodanese-related sulfurtransferase